ncbi:MAG: ABC transporter permease [Actinomycetia bacterium]|nr:ABC transporter permease [Actinomycetes bacterium]
MTLFVVRRGAGAVATFLSSTVLVFIITFALPGDPARAIAGHRQVTASTLSAIRARYGLDQPLWEQYIRWLGRLFRGDLGESFVARRPVSDMMQEALPVTLTLVVLTVVIEVVLGLVVGASVARRSGQRSDNAVLAVCTIGLSVPLFVVGSLTQDLFGIDLRWLPVAGTRNGIFSYVLPALTLALPGIAIAVRLVRAESITQLRAPHTRTARGKGITEAAILRRHVVRNGSVPFVSFVGLEIGALVGGAIVVERVFNLPGVGRAIAQAISQRDNATIIGFTMAIIAVYLLVDLLTDVATMALDPRIERSS